MKFELTCFWSCCDVTKYLQTALVANVYFSEFASSFIQVSLASLVKLSHPQHAAFGLLSQEKVYPLCDEVFLQYRHKKYYLLYFEMFKYIPSGKVKLFFLNLTTGIPAREISNSKKICALMVRTKPKIFIYFYVCITE